jgi:predicted tellurium resistance membrane protein TerC
MEWFSDPQIWISLLTLTILEIVLGIDNIVFITILADKLPMNQRKKARQTGLILAMAMRIILLLSLAWLIGLTAPFFTVFNIGISGRDIILLIGGLFLLGKSTFEIHEKLEGEEGHASSKVRAQFRNVIVQIMLLDIVFSLDSVITAVGMADEVAVMISAVIIAVIIMMLSVNVISDFISDHPTIKILALSFLLLIGFSLVVEGLHQEIPKGYIYFAMGFSIFVEFLNLRMRQKTKKPIELREAYVPVEDPKKPK